MAEVPIKFRKSGKRSVSYSMQDLVTGTAYGIFYGGDFVDGRAITTAQNYAILGYTSSDATYTFPTTFNLTLVAKGIAFVQIAPFWKSPSGTQNITVTITPSILKNSTTLVTGTAKSETKSSTTTAQASVWTWYMTIPETVFETGDQLVLSILLDTGQSTGLEISGFMNDPKDRNTTGATGFITSQLVLNMPFRSDI